MLEIQLEKIKETLEEAVEENVTISLRGYFFQELGVGRTKAKALEMAVALAKEFGFDAPSGVNNDGVRWLEIGNDPIRLIIYYTASLGEKIDEVEESLAKLKA